MIEKIHMQSADEKWNPKFITSAAIDKLMFKILNLSKFSFYFDTNPQMLTFNVWFVIIASYNQVLSPAVF
jgi:hypothetical protein